MHQSPKSLDTRHSNLNTKWHETPLGKKYNFNQSINQSIKVLLRQYPRRGQAQWCDSQTSVQQQNRGNSSVTSTGHGE